MQLSLLKGTFAVCRLDKSSPLPGWLTESTFFYVSRTYDELSFVCSEEVVPANIKCNRNWRCLQVEGPIPFEVTGILASLATTLADARISVFVFSTYDTDYVMVKDVDLENAVRALEGKGHGVIRYAGNAAGEGIGVFRR
jgi:hypothetical protein